MKVKQITSNLFCLFISTFLICQLFSCNTDQEEDGRVLTAGAYDLNADSDGTFGGTANEEEGYNEIIENPWLEVSEASTSTFSIDADGGSYANVRRFLDNDQLPMVDAIRTEELINYFQYEYAEPEDGAPISLEGEIADCPWDNKHKLLHIGLKGKHVEREALAAANFVLLLDVSGSMSSSNKLPLLIESFNLFADNMRDDDRIAIVTYTGNAGVVLESTPGSRRDEIKAAISRLESGGSTNGEGGIIKAYEIALDNFIEGGNNRVILGTDGDFNVGVSDQDELIALIEEKRESGVFLSVLGVGTGNYQDGKMEQLANNGNGTYEYIDDIDQARKVFVDEMGKFYAVAKDVKIQVEFNPANVLKYRLIGYENRLLNNEDFEDDTKDAGEIGVNQAVTALYELEMRSVASFTTPSITIDFRYKQPDGQNSNLLDLEVFDDYSSFENASENLRFAAAVASYGLQLRDSEYKGDADWDDILKWASEARTFDPNNYRGEFLELVAKAKELQ